VFKFHYMISSSAIRGSNPENDRRTTGINRFQKNPLRQTCHNRTLIDKEVVAMRKRLGRVSVRTQTRSVKSTDF
jgi:hypothetical protein